MADSNSTNGANGKHHSRDSEAVADVDDRLIRLLVDFDEALLAGTLSGASILMEAPVPPELADQVESHQEFLAFLHEAARAASPQSISEFPANRSSSRFESPVEFGRFQVVREIGHGAQGIVFLAFDPALKRHVAVKAPRWESLHKPEHRRRFLREAEIVARLTHPNIVAVHEIGCEDPVWYIASDYCQGPTLAEWLKGRQSPVGADSAARFVETLARAVQYAHERGVVHRDLKPSNVILTWEATSTSDAPSTDDLGTLTPKLTDFGLARMEDDAEQTRTGVVIGTPAYMSPEQAEGRQEKIGAATDVYGLGAILYEMLTGRPPIVGSSDSDTLRRISTEDPEAPSKRELNIPRNLDAICLKCLEKDPARRYSSANDLAEDLARHLRGEPITARRASVLETTVKWVCRHPTGSVLLSLIAVLAVTIPVVSARTNSRLRSLLATALEGEKRAEADRYDADARLGFELLRFQDARLGEVVDSRRSEPSGSGFFDRFEWQFLNRHRPIEKMRLTAHDDAIYFMRASTDGRYLFTAGRDNVLKVWLIGTTEPIRVFHLFSGNGGTCPVAVSEDGRFVAFAPKGRDLQVFEALTGRSVVRLAQTVNVAAMAFSPSGNRLAVGGIHSLAMYDWTASRKLWEMHSLGDETREHGFSPVFLQFSHEGSCLALGCDVNGAKWTAVFRADSGQLAGPINRSPTEFAKDASLAAERLALLAGTDADGRAVLRNLENTPGISQGPLGGFSTTSCFSIEQRRAISIGPGDEVCVFNLTTGAHDHDWKDYSGARPCSVALVGKSSLAAVGHTDGSLVVWDSGAPSFPLHPPSAPVLKSIFAAAVGKAAFASVDGQGRIWSLADARLGAWERLGIQGGEPLALALSPKGESLAAVTAKGIELWNMSEKTMQAFQSQPPPEIIVAPVFTSDGKSLLSKDSAPGRLSLWSVDPGPKGVSELKRRRTLSAPADVLSMTFSSDDQTLLVGSADNTVRRLDVATGKERAKPIELPTRPVTLSTSSDGRRLAVGLSDGAVHLFDFTTNQIRWKKTSDELNSKRFAVANLAFSPDNSLLFSSRGDLVCQRADTGQPVWQIKDSVDSFALVADAASLYVLSHSGVTNRTVSQWSLDGLRTKRLPNWLPRSLESIAVLGESNEVVACDSFRDHSTGLAMDSSIRRWIFGRGVFSDAVPWTSLGDHVKLWKERDLTESSWLGDAPIFNARTLVAGAHRHPWFATGGRDGSVEIWNTKTHERTARLFISEPVAAITQAAERIALRALPMMPEYEKDGESIAAIAFSADDQRIAVAGARGSVRCWTTSDWKPAGQFQLNEQALFAVFSPRDGTLAIGQRRSVFFWDGKESQPGRSLDVSSVGTATCGVFSSDGRRLIVGSKGREITVFDMDTGKRTAVLSGHTGSVSALAISPDGKTLASGSHDGTVRLWDVDTFRDIGILGRHRSRAHALAFSKDGMTLYSAGDCDEHGAGALLIWKAK